MDEIAQRLKTTSENCVKSYEAWEGQKKDAPAREALQEAVHELRKVAARLEIEIAVSERDEMASKPLPIPPHRSSKKRVHHNNERNNNNNNSENKKTAPKANAGAETKTAAKPRVQRGRTLSTKSAE